MATHENPSQQAVARGFSLKCRSSCLVLRRKPCWIWPPDCLEFQETPGGSIPLLFSRPGIHLCTPDSLLTGLPVNVSQLSRTCSRVASSVSTSPAPEHLLCQLEGKLLWGGGRGPHRCPAGSGRKEEGRAGEVGSPEALRGQPHSRPLPRGPSRGHPACAVAQSSTSGRP